MKFKLKTSLDIVLDYHDYATSEKIEFPHKFHDPLLTKTINFEDLWTNVTNVKIYQIFKV
jgi:hypothetical protein